MFSAILSDAYDDYTLRQQLLFRPSAFAEWMRQNCPKAYFFARSYAFTTLLMSAFLLLFLGKIIGGLATLLFGLLLAYWMKVLSTAANLFAPRAEE